jgi:hypothetical protein
MEARLEAAVIKTAGEWALFLTKESEISPKDNKELLQKHYQWAKKFLSKEIEGSGIF